MGTAGRYGTNSRIMEKSMVVKIIKQRILDNLKEGIMRYAIYNIPHVSARQFSIVRSTHLNKNQKAAISACTNRVELHQIARE